MAVAVNQWLRQRWRFEAPTEWLEACVDWIREENQGRIVTDTDLRNQVLEQWLLCDLTDVGAGSLPAGITQQVRVSLSGHYCLQVNSTLDASTPYYGQIKKLQGDENENVNVTAAQYTQTQQAKAGRMLMFDMTDGSQTIRGMEYHPIPGIDANLPPGSKVIISGPVLCPRGCLMLTKENWTLLGGEVETLMHNNQLNVLKKTLDEQSTSLASGQRNAMNQKKTFENKPSKPQHSKSAMSLQSSVRQKPAANLLAKSESADNFMDNLNPNQLDALDQQWDEDDDDLLFEVSLIDNRGQYQQQGSGVLQPNYQNNRPNNNTWVTEQTPRSSVLSAKYNRGTEVPGIPVGPVVIKTEAEMERQFESGGDVLRQLHNPVQPQTNVGLKHDMEWDDDDDFAMVDVSLNRYNQSDKKPLKITDDLNQQSSINKANTKSTMADQLKPKIDVIPDDDIRMVLEPALEGRCSVTLTSRPYTYLLLVNRHLPCKRYHVVTVKAYVATLSSRLEHGDGRGWSLSVKINDGTASTVADLGDQFLASLIGFTAQECHEMREQAKYNKQIKLRIAQGMKKCQNSLVQMAGLLHLELTPHKLCPTVIRCVRFTQQDVQTLQQRLI